ncbi:4Fe-4S dicluster domain-containing protein [Paludisphaera sp.]|uniref:4Fe-4S dicluster domain-containing protein n=1 Tax=Paludisphaera sp. TaxID=2017432 RepID=UPI00301C72DC
MMKPQTDDLARPLTLDELVQGAAQPEPPRVWRSLEELADPDAAAGRAANAAARAQAAIYGLGEVGRRDFMTVMGASLALAGVTGCGVQPAEKIVPYVDQPEQIVPGKPLFFATASPSGGDGLGLLVESQMGRPIKVEGNPSHPASRGATDPFAQAEALALYDPDRSQVVVNRGRVGTWENFLRFAVDLRAREIAAKGAGLRILTRSVSSPTVLDQLRRLKEAMPELVWHSYEPVTRDGARKGAELAFGRAFEPSYRLEGVDVVVALDADFLRWGPSSVRLAREYADRRDPDAGTMLRLHAFEPTPTVTGAAADHRTPVASADVLAVAAALARGLGIAGAPDVPLGRAQAHEARISALAEELKAANGKAVVVVGDTQPAEVHALGYAINAALGAIGSSVVLHAPAEGAPADQNASLVQLARDIEAGQVDTLLILDANPAYEAPADLRFEEVLRNEKLTTLVHLGLYNDETGALAHWHVPEAHFLESWGDVRSSDGSVALVQPLIDPLYQGRTVVEVLAVLLGEVGVPGRELVRNYWKTRLPAETFEKSWRAALRDGVVTLPGEAPGPEAPGAPDLGKVDWTAPEIGGSLELIFRPDPTIWDGRYANNAWLQELPKPITTLTWENAALFSPALAERLKLKDGQVVLLKYQGAQVEAPVLITPGQAADTVTVHLGYGRAERAGRVGGKIGFNANLLRRSDAPWAATGLAIEMTNRSVRLAVTQHHHDMARRDVLKVLTVDEYRHPYDEHHAHPDGSLYPEWPGTQSEDYAWGMAIDLNRCIGCAACTIACQAENNIPVVGKDQVLNSREMHWMRVDRYYAGDDLENPQTHFQPLTCMHCEKAPCELVCPVEATTHSDEGLNEMTYNRCVGTRYCGNNCPYKVRRFNYLQYADNSTPSLQLLNNPDVTVRMRGVMEKCTYCVQRINEARINAKMAGGKIGGDEVVTACQGACPTRAIVFGNLKDPESAVSKARESSRHYALLGELGTLPRTTYLSKLTNPAGGAEARGTEAHEEPKNG